MAIELPFSTGTHPNESLAGWPAVQGTEVSFWPVNDVPDGPLSVRCLLGGKGTGQSEYIETTGGGGIWEEVIIPFQPPRVVWRGPKEAYKHKIPLLLEGFEREADVSQVRERIEFLAGMSASYLNEVENLAEPPRLRLDGGGFIAHDLRFKPHFEWVISDSPEWGESIRNREGILIRQAVTVVFTLFTKTIRSQQTQSKFTYATGTETFEHIAHRHWKKKHTHWGKKLAEFNGFPNATEKPEKGIQIFFPTPQEEKHWSKQKRINRH